MKYKSLLIKDESETDFSVLTRAKAKETGLTMYGAGRPCKLDHYPNLRYTCDGSCVQCTHLKHQNPESKKQAAVRREKAREKPETKEYFQNYHKGRYSLIKADPLLYEQEKESARLKLERLKQNPEKYEASLQQKRDYRQTPKAQEASKERYRLFREDQEAVANHIQYCIERNRLPEVKEHNRVLRQTRRQENPVKYRAKDAEYRSMKLDRTPKWADLEAIRQVYKEAFQLSKRYGTEVEVDHAVPLQGEDVCGFHVEYNLQPMFACDNRAKSNTFTEEDAEKQGIWYGADYYVNGWTWFNP
jgi:hypothetical protein